jgi:hypothetical protein
MPSSWKALWLHPVVIKWICLKFCAQWDRKFALKKSHWSFETENYLRKAKKWLKYSKQHDSRVLIKSLSCVMHNWFLQVNYKQQIFFLNVTAISTCVVRSSCRISFLTAHCVHYIYEKLVCGCRHRTPCMAWNFYDELINHFLLSRCQFV